jgi:hypothetical protein
MPTLTAVAPGPLAEQLLTVVDAFARSQESIVVLAAEFADSHEWIVAGSPTAAHWLAGVADVDVATGREWIRIGRQLRKLPASADAFAAGRVSYSKVRTLTRVATPENEVELLGIARSVPAGELGRTLAGWMTRNSSSDELAAHHQRQRSVRWRTEPDGMVSFSLRLPPHIAAMLIAFLSTWVMRSRPKRGDASADAFPTVAQQHADAVESLVSEGGGTMTTEVVLHVRGDGCTLDDGSPIPDSVVASMVPTAFLRALIHDAESRPINASGRQRHPNTRQKRVVRERDRVCSDCGRADLLEYDHCPPYEISRQTVVGELKLRCSPCHRKRHAG